MTEPIELKCKSCGADLPFENGSIALKCPFCGSTTLIDSREKVVDAQYEYAGMDPEAVAGIKKMNAAFAEAEFIGTPKSRFWSCLIMSLIFAGLPLGITTAATYNLWHPYLTAMRWDGSSTFSCNSNQKFSLHNKKANISGAPAIKAEDNCVLTCENCDLKGETAIEVLGNAQVTCTNCNLRGDEVGVFGDVNGNLIIIGGSITGGEAGARLETNADLDASSITISGDTGLDLSNGLNCEVKLKDVKIEGNSVAIDIAKNSKLNSKNSNAKAAIGIRVSDNGDVIYRGGSVEGSDLAVDQHGYSSLEFKNNPKLTGGIQAENRKSIKGLQ